MWVGERQAGGFGSAGVFRSGVQRVNTVAGKLSGHGVTSIVVVSSMVGDVTGSGGEVERMAVTGCCEAWQGQVGKGS